ncbi:helix-turn-helix transcriptional regulator [Deminuibacter soli]|uniref:AraC family transcriptional regulator n=1 Tax=Deminuibacter soli TaxID=2291815 RepID=A0A3E1NEE7_9BACT|nr:AraC family transcriptional regulator [Deminuibacter soli]RFM26349.1 AraC family transcriptional regulator [Deminuibacter soli]
MQQEFAKYHVPHEAAGLECFEGAFTQQCFPWHYHETYTVVMVHAGAAVYDFNRLQLQVNAGEVLVVNPLEPHCNYAAAEPGWTYSVFFLPVHAFAHTNCAVPLFNRSVVCTPQAYTELAKLHTQLKHTADATLVQTGMQQVADCLLQFAAYTKGNQHSDERLLPALSLMEKELYRKLSINELAASCFMSVSHFQRVFKKCMGLTVHAFLHMKRMDAGRRLLNQRLEIAAAAQEAGFFDQSHFHHSFKKMWGLTPGSYLAE